LFGFLSHGGEQFLKKILITSWTVKGEIASPNWYFQAMLPMAQEKPFPVLMNWGRYSFSMRPGGVIRGSTILIPPTGRTW